MYARIRVHPLFIILPIYAVWAAGFIYRSSVTGIDGDIRFTLFDDAMISMRYAWHLVEGHGLVWNIGERVEGYTNPLWTLYMAGTIAVFGPRFAPLAIQVSGLLLMLASVWFVYRTAAEFAARQGVERGNLFAPVAATVLFLSFYPTSYWALAGMEVGALTFVAAAAMYVIVSAWDRPRRPSTLPVLFICLLAAYSLRPDGILVVAPLIAAYLLGRLLDRDYRALAVTSVLGGLFLAAVSMHILWRYGYYGELAPNTYTLKIDGIPLGHRLANGMAYIAQFLLAMLLPGILAGYLLRRYPSGLSVVLLTVPVTLIAYQIYVGGDPWLLWRQVDPGITALFIVIASGCAKFLSLMAEKQPDGRVPTRLFAAVVVGLAVVGFVPNSRYPGALVHLGPPSTFDVHGALVRTAEASRAILEPDAAIAVTWAGNLPYFWQGRTIDMLGKSDSHVARLPPDLKRPAGAGIRGLPGHNKYDLDYSIVSKQPDLVQLWAWARQDLTPYITEHYVEADYRGLRLCLKKGSTQVRWEEVDVIGPGCRTKWLKN